MSAYSDTILAEPSLLNYWKLRNEQDLKGSLPLVFGSAITRLEAGRVIDDDHAIKFNSASTSNSIVSSSAPPSAYQGPHSIEVLLKFSTQNVTHTPQIFICGLLGNSIGTALSMQRVDTDPSKPVRLVVEINSTTQLLQTMPVFGDTTIFGPGWHHVVITVGGSGGICDCYVNGVNVASGSFNGVPYLFRASAIMNLGNGGIATTCFNGWMQHVSVYNTKLSLATVQAHYATLGPVATTTYRAPGLAYSSRTRVRDFGIATLTKSLPRTLAVAKGGIYRAGRGEGGFEFPSGTMISPPNPLVGGVSRPGRMVGDPPGEFALPAPIAPKVVNLGAGGGEVARPLEGQIWPR